MELKKGQNMIDHEAEIYARPARTWFQTGKEKAQAAGKPQHLWLILRDVHSRIAAVSKEQYEAGRKVISHKSSSSKEATDKARSSHIRVHDTFELTLNFQPKRDKFAGLTRKAKRRKLALEEDEEQGESRAIKAAVRSAKKAQRPGKIGLPEKRLDNPKAKAKAKRAQRVANRKGSSFDKDMNQKAPREGVRARKGDAIGGIKKKGGKRKGK